MAQRFGVTRLAGAANFWHRRKLKGITEQQMAAAAEMERSQVSELERATRNISVVALGRIADALGIEPHILLLKDGRV